MVWLPSAEWYKHLIVARFSLSERKTSNRKKGTLLPQAKKHLGGNHRVTRVHEL
jgi:hypothetical protein